MIKDYYRTIGPLLVLYYTERCYDKICYMQRLIYDFDIHDGCNKCRKDTINSCWYLRETFHE